MEEHAASFGPSNSTSATSTSSLLGLAETASSMISSSSSSSPVPTNGTSPPKKAKRRRSQYDLSANLPSAVKQPLLKKFHALAYQAHTFLLPKGQEAQDAEKLHPYPPMSSFQGLFYDDFCEPEDVLALFEFEDSGKRLWLKSEDLPAAHRRLINKRPRDRIFAESVPCHATDLGPWWLDEDEPVAPAAAPGANRTPAAETIARAVPLPTSQPLFVVGPAPTRATPSGPLPRVRVPSVIELGDYRLFAQCKEWLREHAAHIHAATEAIDEACKGLDVGRATPTSDSLPQFTYWPRSSILCLFVAYAAKNEVGAFDSIVRVHAEPRSDAAFSMGVDRDPFLWMLCAITFSKTMAPKMHFPGSNRQQMSAMMTFVSTDVGCLFRRCPTSDQFGDMNTYALKSAVSGHNMALLTHTY